MKINVREVARRTIKYLVLVLTVCYSGLSLKKKLTIEEIGHLGLIAGLCYCLLDILSPSLDIVKDKN